MTCALLLSLLSGCGFFSRSKSNFYSLERIAPAAAPVAAVRPALPVGIDTLELPPGFDRKDVVVRKAEQQLDIRGTEQWSADFRPLVLHTLAFDLANRLPQGSVILPGEAKPQAMRSINVVFAELAAGPENAVTLDAQWSLAENGKPTLTHHEQITVDVPSLASAQVANGVSQALAQLADRMAAALR